MNEQSTEQLIEVLRLSADTMKGTELQQHYAADMRRAADRLEQLEGVVARLPWCWDWRDGQWVKVPVVPGMRYWFHYTDAPDQIGCGFASNIENEELAEDFSQCFATPEAASQHQGGGGSDG